MIRTYLSLLAVVSVLAVQSAAAQSGQSASRPAAPPMVNINTALAAQLEALPGVGPATAARIIEYREKNGPFKKLEELMNVRGMGEKTFLKLRPQLTLTAPKTETAREQHD
jgi:competence protein ComEA